MIRKMNKVFLAAAVVMMLVAGTVWAGPSWTGAVHAGGGDNLWTTDLNWAEGIAPTQDSTPVIRTSYYDELDYPVFQAGMSGQYTQLIVGYPDSPADPWPARLDITGGTMLLNDLWISFAFAPSWLGVINMSGGSVSCGHEIRVGYYGAVGTLNMSGGLLTCAANMYIGPDGGKGILNLTGGTISVNYLGMFGTTSSIYIRGTANLSMPDANGLPNGPIMSKLTGWASSGGIATPDRAAQLFTDPNLYCLKIEWNGVNTTTVSAKQYGANQASKPQPVQYRLGVTAPLTLGWTKGATAVSHNVYIGTDFTAVNTATNPNVLPGRGNQTGVTYTATFPLEYAKTYYWRIDEVAGANIYKGEVWQFTSTPGDICSPVLAGDLNGDCVVNFNDFAAMALNWLECTKTLMPCP